MAWSHIALNISLQDMQIIAVVYLVFSFRSFLAILCATLSRPLFWIEIIQIRQDDHQDIRHQIGEVLQVLQCFQKLTIFGNPI